MGWWVDYSRTRAVVACRLPVWWCQRGSTVSMVRFAVDDARCIANHQVECIVGPNRATVFEGWAMTFDQARQLIQVTQDIASTLRAGCGILLMIMVMQYLRTIFGVKWAMVTLIKAVNQMEDAARGLRPYMQHVCSYHQIDSPDGDVCICGYYAAVIAANDALAQLREVCKFY
jgi:hypothetical protein